MRAEVLMPALEYLYLLSGWNSSGAHGVAPDAVAQGLHIERGIFQRGAGIEAAGMAEDVAHGDGMHRFLKQDVIGVLFSDDHLTLELRQVFFHGVIEADLALRPPAS